MSWVKSRSREELEHLVTELDVRRCAAESHIKRRAREWAEGRQKDYERRRFLEHVLDSLQAIDEAYNAAPEALQERISDLVFDVQAELGQPI